MGRFQLGKTGGLPSGENTKCQVSKYGVWGIPGLCNYRPGVHAGRGGGGVATSRGWLEPYVFCYRIRFILLLKTCKVGHGMIIVVFGKITGVVALRPNGLGACQSAIHPERWL